MNPGLVALALAAVFTALAALHIWWALRPAAAGQPPRLSSAVIPQVDGKPVFAPSRNATFAVAAALLAAAAVVLVRAGIMLPAFPPHLAKLASAVLGLVLLARAVGDFRLVGFFKRVRGSRFATLDTRFYAPLCLLLALATLWLAFGPHLNA